MGQNTGAGLVLEKSHGLPLDHVGLGVSDTEQGARQIERLTGVEISLRDPEPGQWYWSGAVALGRDSFLEIIGPNPAWRGFNPIRQHLKGLKKPELLFWYVETGDFDRFAKAAKECGAPVERIERINTEDDPAYSRYVRGIIGPGFISQRPNVIEWQRRHFEHGSEGSCRLTDLRLTHPQAGRLNAVFEELGIAVSVQKGPSSIGISLEKPAGEVSFDNPGMDIVGLSGMLKMLGQWLSWRVFG